MNLAAAKSNLFAQQLSPLVNNMLQKTQQIQKPGSTTRKKYNYSLRAIPTIEVDAMEVEAEWGKSWGGGRRDVCMGMPWK